MKNIRKCDYCGKEIKQGEIFYKLIELSIHAHGTRPIFRMFHDMCNNCHRSFTRWRDEELSMMKKIDKITGETE